MATTRIYLAKIKTDDKITRRLVRASHPSPVASHVSQDLIKVSIPTPDELYECAAAGIKVEDLQPQQPDQLPLGDGA